MTEDEKIFSFDSDMAAQRVSQMWAKLGEQLAESCMSVGDHQLAIRYACAAEACFWKATGEADTHDVKDVLAMALSSEDRA